MKTLTSCVFLESVEEHSRVMRNLYYQNLKRNRLKYKIPYLTPNGVMGVKNEKSRFFNFLMAAKKNTFKQLLHPTSKTEGGVRKNIPKAKFTKLPHLRGKKGWDQKFDFTTEFRVKKSFGLRCHTWKSKTEIKISHFLKRSLSDFSWVIVNPSQILCF